MKRTRSPDIDLGSDEEEEESPVSSADKGSTAEETELESDLPPKKSKVKGAVPGKGQSLRGGKSIAGRKQPAQKRGAKIVESTPKCPKK